MSPLRLRPHHILCIGFFEGKGYSQEFIENMYKIIGMLRSDPEIYLSSSADCICQSCPNNKEGSCVTAEKVRLYDNAVLELCGLSYGEVIHWNDLRKLAVNEILIKNNFKKVCSDCKWTDICSYKNSC